MQKVRKQLAVEGLGEVSSQDEINVDADKKQNSFSFALGESMELREELEELRIDPNSTKDD